MEKREIRVLERKRVHHIREIVSMLYKARYAHTAVMPLEFFAALSPLFSLHLEKNGIPCRRRRNTLSK